MEARVKQRETQKNQEKPKKTKRKPRETKRKCMCLLVAGARTERFTQCLKGPSSPLLPPHLQLPQGYAGPAPHDLVCVLQLLNEVLHNLRSEDIM